MFMTTNYIERLDPALIRPGRVDMIEMIDYCSRQQLREMFRRFYPGDADARADIFADKICSLGVPISAAQVQGYFMFYKTDSQLAIDNVFRFKPVS